MSQPVKILIVDDEPDICYFLSRNLSKRGYSTSFCHTLRDAETEIRTGRPAILFLDNHLTDGKGIDLLHRIGHLYPEMKTVMITAHDSPQDRTKAYTNGASFFLSKPFTLTEINRVVDLLLAEK